MKIVLITLATMPLTFSACKSSPTGSPKMTEPAMGAAATVEAHAPGMMGSAPAMGAAMTGAAHGPGMMGAAPAMAEPAAAAPAMVPGATMTPPGAALAPALAGGAARTSDMGAKSKPAMKMADDKKGHAAGTRL